MGDKRYSIILADPPWQYDRRGTPSIARGDAAAHYPTMTEAELCALPVKELASKNAALFMWATWPKLPEALRVMAAWGFKYKTVGFVWVKTNPSGFGIRVGVGWWTNANTEICLIGTRGSARRACRTVRQVMFGPVTKHSRKPDETHDRIERLMGDLPRVELFARRPHDGWDVWGNEVASDIEMELTA